MSVQSGYKESGPANGDRKYKHTLKNFVMRKTEKWGVAEDRPGIGGRVF